MSSEEIQNESKKITLLNIEEKKEYINDISVYLKDFKVHADDVIELLKRQSLEIENQKAIQSSFGVFINQRNSEAKRALLNTREQGILNHPLFARTGALPE